MCEIDNFELIKPLLNFSDGKHFYFLQIIKRRKDKGNESLPKTQRIIKDFYIYSLEELDKYTDEIKSLCAFYNARAYIRLNKCNEKKVAFQVNKRIADLLYSENYRGFKSIYSSVAGEVHHDDDTSWIVDVDYAATTDFTKFQNAIIDKITLLSNYSQAIKAIIPTKNGIHIIARPFNLGAFSNQFPVVDVHKHNPTLLYML